MKFLSVIGLFISSQIFAQTHVVLTTNKGEIEIELFDKQAPNSVKNFLRYVDNGHYNGLIFHRVIKNFMIQGGGFTTNFQEKKTDSAIQNEADNGLSNDVGTLAMARTQNPHSATSQFFVNLKKNSWLDHQSKTPDGWGYTVFGKVAKGMPVVNQIATVPTTINGPHRDVPVENIIILKAERKK